jgi:hypothetical protein
VGSKPVLRLNIGYDAVSLLERAWSPPGEGRLFCDPRLYSVLRSLNWVCFLNILQRDPGCALVLPLNEELPANGGFLSSPSPRSSYEGVLLEDLLAVCSVIDDFLKKDMTIAFVINFSEQVLGYCISCE